MSHELGGVEKTQPTTDCNDCKALTINKASERAAERAEQSTSGTAEQTKKNTLKYKT